MKATSASPPFKRSQTPFSSTILARPKSELLFELFSGTLGRVQLGRMLSGNDVGRLVLLRELPGPPAAEFELEVERAKAIAHPRLAKTLGVFRAAETWQLASEYIPGVTLSELSETVASRGEKMDPTVAARVLLDALEGLLAARELLPAAVNAPKTRCIFPESIWVADFGETFLSEVSTSALLARATPAGTEADGSANREADRDIPAAGLLLLELACGSAEPSALEDPLVPAALREIIARATGLRQAPRFTSLAAFAGALSALDGGIASDDEVSEELRRLMGPVLEIRRQKLAMTERVAVQPGEQDETKFFRAAARNAQRETTRPPAAMTSELPAEAKISPSLRIVVRSEPPEDPTAIFQRPKLESEAGADTAASADEAQQAPTDAVLDPSIDEAAPPTSGSHAPLEVDGAPSSGARTARRIAILLLLLAAGLVFALTSQVGPAPSSSATSAHPSWIKSELAKLRHLF